MHLNSEEISHKVRYTTLRTTETKVTAVRLKTNPFYVDLFIVSTIICEVLTQMYFA